MKKDWRLTNQENYLKNRELYRSNYIKNDSNDHDHCVFCMLDFISEEESGYCTTDYYHWICEKCFDDFNDVFDWSAIKK